jgi:hypothetical protein
MLAEPAIGRHDGGFEMKAPIVMIAGLAAVFSTGVHAANWATTCFGAACLPFTPTNSYVLSLAVGVAQANSAAVGDNIAVDYTFQQPGICAVKVHNWTVSRSPVLNSADLDFRESDCLNP